jgi:hypothetical protein
MVAVATANNLTALFIKAAHGSSDESREGDEVE